MSEPLDKWPKERGRVPIQRNVIHERAMMNLRSKNDSRDGQNHHEENVSQSVQSFLSRLADSEAKISQEKNDLLELTELSEREQQKYLEIQLETEQLHHQYEVELEKQNLFSTKLNHLTSVFQQLQSDGNDLTDGLHRIIADRETVEHSQIKDELEYAKQTTEKLTGSAKYEIQHHSSTLSEIMEKNLKYEADFQEKFQSNELLHIDSQSSLRGQMSKISSVLQELEMALSHANTLSENLKMQQELNFQHWAEVEDSLTKKTEVPQEEEALTISQITDAKEEIAELTGQLQCLNDELDDNNQRFKCIEANNVLKQKDLECLSQSLVSMTTEEQDLLMESDTLLNLNSELRSEIEDIRKHLMILEESTRNETLKLDVELENSCSDAAKYETDLQKSLNDIILKSANLSQEVDELKQQLTETNQRLQCMSESNNQISQSNSLMEIDLAAVVKELEHLNREKTRTFDLLDAEQSAVQQLEHSINMSKESFEKSISEYQSTLKSLLKEEGVITEELASLSTIELKLCKEIEETEKGVAFSSLKMDESQTSIKIKYINKISCLEREIETLRSAGEKSVHELEERLVVIRRIKAESKSYLQNLDVSIQELNQELENHVNSLKTFREEKGVQESAVQELIVKMNKCSADLNLKSTEERELQASIEQDRLISLEADNQLSELNFKIQEVQSDLSMTVAKHEKEKEVFLRDLVTFQQTCDGRLQEIEVLKKQVAMWKRMTEDLENKTQQLQSTLTSTQGKVQDAIKRENYLAEKLSVWNSNLKTAKRELKKLEMESSFYKDKADRCRKIIKAVKKKYAQKENDSFVALTQESRPQREVTPKYESDAAPKAKEVTPRSILKPPSKPPTPLLSRKRVSFADDFDDNASSSSSIILEPEMCEMIAKNPAMRYQIAVEQKEKRLAAKRMKYSAGILNQGNLTSPKVDKAPEDEISSSTPEPAEKLF